MRFMFVMLKLIEHFHVKSNITLHSCTLSLSRFFLGAHTCDFSIDLPVYLSACVMYERLNYTITYCSSIDGDGTVNDMPDIDQFNLE